MATTPIFLAFDKTGVSPDNLVQGETHKLVGTSVRLVIPDYCSFYKDSLKVTQTDAAGAVTQLSPAQFRAVEHLPYISLQTNREVYCGILILDTSLSGEIKLSYQATGGADQGNGKLLKQGADDAMAKSLVSWDKLVHPDELPPSAHIHHVEDLYNADPLIEMAKRIAFAVGKMDVALEKDLLGYNVADDMQKLFDVYNVGWNLRLDMLSLICSKVKETLVLTSQAFAFTQQLKRSVAEQLKVVKTQLAAYAMNQRGGIYAMVLRELVRQQKSVYGTLLGSPKRIDGLSSWLDFGRASLNGKNFSVQDRVDPTNAWTGYGMLLVDNAALGVKALQLFDKQQLVCAGPGISIGPNSTVFVVSAKYGDNPSKGVLLSNTVAQISIDIENAELLKITEAGAVKALTRSQLHDGYSAHLGVFAFGDDTLVSYCESNTVLSTYRGVEGFAETPSLSAQIYKQIGSLTAEQHINIAEIIVYNRYLSKYEVDAVGEYLALKYKGLRTNLVGNGSFFDGLAEFETDYNLSKQALNPVEIACLNKIELGKAGGSYYSTGLFDPALQHLPVGKNFLAVHQKYNNWTDYRMIWVQRHRLVRGHMYLLEFDIHYEKNTSINVLPYMTLHTNGVRRIGRYINTAGNFGVDTIKFGFIAQKDDNVLQLWSDARSEACFGIDDIRLTRDFRIQLPFVNSGGTVNLSADNPLSAITLNTSKFLIIKAKSDLAGGVGANMEVWVDGAKMGSVIVDNSTTWADFKFGAPYLKTSSKVDVKFTNDSNVGGDRNLRIESITDGVSLMTSKSTNVTVDAGIGAALTDGSQIMLWSNGAMHVVWPTVNDI
jgi:Ca-dependent carbohydrate-binding module xylan-binding